jgi:glycerate 2-kinase
LHKFRGASKDELIQLENGMKKFCDSVKIFDLTSIKGTGAAGGISGGFLSFFHGCCNLLPGSELIAKHVNLEEQIKMSDIIFTGEGSIDEQSENGKVVNNIEKLTKKYDKKLFFICGKSEKKQENIFPLVKEFSLEDSMNNTENCIFELVKNKIIPSL